MSGAELYRVTRTGVRFASYLPGALSLTIGRGRWGQPAWIETLKAPPDESYEAITEAQSIG